MYHHGMVASLPAVTLTPRAPFDARPILGYYGRSPLEPLDIVVDGAWRRAVRLGGRTVLFEVAAGGTVEAPSLTVRLLAESPPPPSPGLRPRRGDEGPSPLRSGRGGAGTEPWRWPPRPWRAGGGSIRTRPSSTRSPRGTRSWAGCWRGCTVRASPLMPSPFECLVWAILGQQITVAFAYKMKRALVERYGESLAHEGRTYWLFPEAARLAEADPAELREIQFSRQKSDYVRSLAALVAEDRIDWAELRDDALRGGDQGADRAARGRALDRRVRADARASATQDVIPAADVGLQSAIGRAYGLGRKATEAEVRALAERWVPRRSHAAFAWWWSLSAERGHDRPAAMTLAILADDLTGACDSAVPFARRGLATRVLLAPRPVRGRGRRARGRGRRGRRHAPAEPAAGRRADDGRGAGAPHAGDDAPVQEGRFDAARARRAGDPGLPAGLGCCRWRCSARPSRRPGAGSRAARSSWTGAGSLGKVATLAGLPADRRTGHLDLATLRAGVDAVEEALGRARQGRRARGGRRCRHARPPDDAGRGGDAAPAAGPAGRGRRAGGGARRVAGARERAADGIGGDGRIGRLAARPALAGTSEDGPPWLVVAGSQTEVTHHQVVELARAGAEVIELDVDALLARRSVAESGGPARGAPALRGDVTPVAPAGRVRRWADGAPSRGPRLDERAARALARACRTAALERIAGRPLPDRRLDGAGLPAGAGRLRACGWSASRCRASRRAWRSAGAGTGARSSPSRAASERRTRSAGWSGRARRAGLAADRPALAARRLTVRTRTRRPCRPPRRRGRRARAGR